MCILHFVSWHDRECRKVQRRLISLLSQQPSCEHPVPHANNHNAVHTPSHGDAETNVSSKPAAPLQQETVHASSKMLVATVRTASAFFSLDSKLHSSLKHTKRDFSLLRDLLNFAERKQILWDQLCNVGLDRRCGIFEWSPVETTFNDTFLSLSEPTDAEVAWQLLRRWSAVKQSYILPSRCSSSKRSIKTTCV